MSRVGSANAGNFKDEVGRGGELAGEEVEFPGDAMPANHTVTTLTRSPETAPTPI